LLRGSLALSPTSIESAIRTLVGGLQKPPSVRAREEARKRPPWLAQTFSRASGFSTVLGSNANFRLHRPSGQSSWHRAGSSSHRHSYRHSAASTRPVADPAAKCAQGQPGSPSVLGVWKGIDRQRAYVLFESVC
jgi:hypothetical protein